MLLWTAAAAYFAFALLILALRYAILPQIESYRPTLERVIGEAINRPVALRRVSAHWDGLRPALEIDGFEIRDVQGRPALVFDQVEAVLSWRSLWHRDLRLARLELGAPALQLRRDTQGRFFVAGLELTPDPRNEDNFLDWLLLQDSVVIRDASIAWSDELRGAPTLELRHLDFQLDNSGRRHRFGLSAAPPPALAARIDLRGDFRGEDLDDLASLKGEAYAELDYADLAVWRTWVDYPLDLPQGRGALRLWMGFAARQATSVTADLRLADVRVRLRPDLPELELERLQGRIAVRRIDHGYSAEIKRLALATRDGLALPETDLTLHWQAPAGKPAQGLARADGLDLGVLAGLAAHLPFDDGSRARLARHAPQGRVHDFSFEWSSAVADRTALTGWKLNGRFERLAIRALGPIPGVSGISGTVNGTEKAGSLVLNGRKTVLELPAIFAEPRLELDALAAEADWRVTNEGLQVRLQKSSFHNRDAAGEASGTWRPLARGPGQIDLQARLGRGSGEAVWRYIPLAVGQDVRDWLHAAIVGGKATDATLRLRGDLWDFPFADGRNGLFEVRGKFTGATLRYASEWPEINDIDGELLFSGQRMLITGKSGRILGARLRNVRAEIADLGARQTLLTVQGKAAGQTAEFLRYIEASPVGERIDHFTAGMRAQGSGELDLKLALPLHDLEKSKVEGSYRFDGNRLVVDPELPPLTDVRGGLRFTADHLEARGLRASLLNLPLTADLRTVDGAVLVSAAGEAGVATLRQQLPHPVFDHLAGSAKWTGRLRVKKRDVEVKLASDLLGISSSLPAPFNKPATQILPLTLERRPLPEVPRAAGRAGMARSPAAATPATVPAAGQEMLELALGGVLRAQLVRRQDGGRSSIVRGTIAVGDATAALPERQLAIAMNVARVDGDFWRRLLEGGPASGREPPSLPALPALQFDLRTGSLTLQEKNLTEARITGSRGEASPLTRFELKSREVTGSFEWNGSGAGKLTGRLAQFAIPETAATPDVLQARTTEVIERIPALDVTVEQLSFKNRPLGTVRVAAENRDAVWNVRLEVRNEDGSMDASGRWRRQPAQAETQAEFRIEAKRLDKMLARAGHPDAIRRGNATLSGELSWSGSPFRIDYPSLGGKLKLEAAGGQFVKLEPGVGRLLGILSLQSLPRRITLDFRDIFSQGFAFDTIGGDFAVSRGIMRTEELQIRGPSARVLMRGKVDLGSETQDLLVRVQPAVGETLAVGTMLANPIAGAVVWAAQKLFKDPLDQAFAFEYGVTGSWVDPKVEKLNQVPVKADEERK